MKWYKDAVVWITQGLIGRSKPSDLAFVGTRNGTTFVPYMEHVTCFFPAVLALGYLQGCPQAHLSLAKDLMHTCYLLYKQSPSGLAPEAVYFNQGNEAQADFKIKDEGVDMQNFLRPEAVESLFVLYQVTREQHYLEWGWDIFQAFEKVTFISSGGYSSVLDVRDRTPRYKDRMESFFLSETLKYLFLLFSDNVPIQLDKWVFNTQGHPLRIH